VFPKLSDAQGILSPIVNMSSSSLLSTNGYQRELVDSVETIVKCFESIADKMAMAAAVPHGNTCSGVALTTGLYTALHVFQTVLLYTRSLEMAHIHATKAGVYFSEFVTQITDDGQHYLQLTPKDAVLFSYKKTIYDINSEARACFAATERQQDVMPRVSAVLALSLRIRCYELESLVNSSSITDVVAVNRCNKQLSAALAGCSHKDIDSLSNIADIAVSEGVDPTTCRGLLLAIVRRLRRKGGRLNVFQFYKRLARGNEQLNVAKVAADVVV
jgi:hypothetical protein